MKLPLRPVLVGSFVLAVAGIGGRDARAQAATPTHLFDAVTQYALTPTQLTITGVEHGASAPTTVSLTVSLASGGGQPPAAAACEKQLLVAINRPGRFSVGVYASGNTTVYVTGCVLTQLP